MTVSMPVFPVHCGRAPFSRFVSYRLRQWKQSRHCTDDNCPGYFKVKVQLNNLLLTLHTVTSYNKLVIGGISQREIELSDRQEPSGFKSLGSMNEWLNAMSIAGIPGTASKTNHCKFSFFLFTIDYNLNESDNVRLQSRPHRSLSLKRERDELQSIGTNRLVKQKGAMYSHGKQSTTRLVTKT